MYALSNETQMIDVEHDTRIFFVLKLLNFLKTIYLLVQVFVDDCILEGHKHLSLHFMGSQKKKCGVFIELSIEHALD